MELTFWDSVRSKLGLATVGKPALIGLAVIMVMVAVFVGRIVIDTATATEIPIEHSRAEDVRSDVESPDAVQATTVFVHVSGAVKNPGLYELDEGARVDDAVKAAGGFTKRADQESLNLARKVEDGEHIQVSKLGSDGASAQAVVQGASEADTQSGLVNINSATEQELQALPGIGPSTAAKIAAYRDANGPFSRTEDIKNVSGIGDKKFESIEDLICV